MLHTHGTPQASPHTHDHAHMLPRKHHFTHARRPTYAQHPAPRWHTPHGTPHAGTHPMAPPLPTPRRHTPHGTPHAHTQAAHTTWHLTTTPPHATLLSFLQLHEAYKLHPGHTLADPYNRCAGGQLVKCAPAHRCAGDVRRGEHFSATPPISTLSTASPPHALLTCRCRHRRRRGGGAEEAGAGEEAGPKLRSRLTRCQARAGGAWAGPASTAAGGGLRVGGGRASGRSRSTCPRQGRSDP